MPQQISDWVGLTSYAIVIYSMNTRIHTMSVPPSSSFMCVKRTRKNMHHVWQTSLIHSYHGQVKRINNNVEPAPSLQPPIILRANTLHKFQRQTPYTTAARFSLVMTTYATGTQHHKSMYHVLGRNSFNLQLYGPRFVNFTFQIVFR